jgi:uncharacterized protein
MKPFLIILIYLAWLLAVPVTALAGSDWGPWQAPVAATVSDEAQLEPLQTGIRFFQRFISPVDGPRCPMYPTCSAYATQALQKHGPLFGSFITVDRLLHESGPTFHDHPVKLGGRIRFLDPLSANDRWASSNPLSASDK